LSFVEDATPAVEEAMWSLFAAYVSTMELEVPFNPVQSAHAALQQLPAPGEAPAVTPIIQVGPAIGAVVESSGRADRYEVEFEVVGHREWNGALNANVAPVDQGWRQIR
jgi:hypothetical protein